jgi:catechol 2,3-dioxygenase-like lactoylglutathione lyase family enzyme
MMFSHLTLGTNDHARAETFYAPVMAVLGHPVLMKGPGVLAYGEMAGPKLFIVTPYDKGAATCGNGVHAAFLVQDRATVDAFYEAAMKNGGADEGAPGLRPHYHPNYYGAYVRDPDGNKLQAVCHRAPS